MTTIDLTALHLDRGSHSCVDGQCLMAICRVARRISGQLTTQNDCLIFTGHRDAKGYGRMKIAGRMRGVHRLVYEMSHGPIPDGLVVMHTCDNPPCCNLTHLRLGTVAENNADRHTKGRTVMPTNGPDHLRQRTHCPQGHAYSGNNVRYRPNGARRCAECSRSRAATYAATHRASINARRLALTAAKETSR